jgi:hypothetical protein
MNMIKCGMIMTNTEKEQQEELVAKTFRDDYKNITGIELEVNEKGAQPPDRVFYYGGSQIGCEMFEVEQFYETRGFFGDLEKMIYKEFESCGLKQRYQGMRIDVFAGLTQTNTKKEIKKRWAKRKVKGNRLANCAKELVDLVCKNISSVSSIPANGLRIKTDPDLHPSLSAFTAEILVSKRFSNDLRRYEGKAAPFVVIGGSYLLPSENELVSKLIDEMKKKIKRKHTPCSGWQSINHSVLIAHELPRIPRNQTYLGAIIEWPKYLKIAAEKAKSLDTFDELWFVRPVKIVTEVDIVEPRAQFIRGNHLRR